MIRRGTKVSETLRAELQQNQEQGSWFMVQTREHIGISVEAPEDRKSASAVQSGLPSSQEKSSKTSSKSYVIRRGPLTKHPITCHIRPKKT